MYYQNPNVYGGYPAQPYVVNPGVPTYVPPAPVAVSRKENPIGKEGYELLRRKGGSKLDFFASREEVTRTMCDHTYGGQFQLDLEDYDHGIYRCRICGAVVNLGVNYSSDVIKNILDYAENAWDNMKVRNNGVISNDIIQDMAKALVLLKRLPAAIEAVDKNFSRNEAAQQNLGYRGFNTAQTALNMINGNGGYSYTPSFNPMPSGPVGGFMGNPFMGPNPNMPVAPAPMPPQAPAPVMAYMAPQAQQGVYPVATGQQMYVDPYNNVTYPMPQGQPAPQPQAPQYAAPPQAAGTVVPEPQTQASPQAPTVTPASKHEIRKGYTH